MDKIDELLTRGVANIIPDKESLEKKLRSEKKLNIYLGIDPTATNIHLGHAVPLRQLNTFAELGHTVTFLIGDFTALIGDTSDKDSERPVLSSEQIEENFQTYKKQAEKILDFTKIRVRHNSEWLKELQFSDIVKLCQNFSIGDFISRELIRKRLDEGKRVALHEVLYPVMQGYDSYYMDTDIQLGGTDQTFNMQAGRTLQRVLRSKESFVMSNVFLSGTDGRKMSKSWGNAIWLTDTPENMFAKVMAVNDDVITEYFLLGTSMPIEDVHQVKKRLEGGENPMMIKKDLAVQIVTELHSKEDATKARENFENTVQKGNLPEEITEIQYETDEEQNLEEFLVAYNLTQSKSEAKRLIEQGGVSINEKKETDARGLFDPTHGTILRIGKRTIVKIVRK